MLQKLLYFSDPQLYVEGSVPQIENMTGFQRIELFDICRGNTVKGVGIAWKISLKYVLNV